MSDIEHPPPAEAAPRRGCRVSLLELILIGMLMSLLLIALTPWYRARETRANVVRVKADMRVVGAAVESYFIDNMQYSACGIAEGPSRTLDLPMYQTRIAQSRRHWGNSWTPSIPAPVPTIHSGLPAGSGARRMMTFRVPDRPGWRGPIPHSLTTPIAYLQAYPPDRFADSHGASFGYFNPAPVGSGWVLWSVGPDRDENDPNGPGDIGAIVETIFDWRMARPRAPLLLHSYDPTNGTYSNGDIIRAHP